MRIPFLGAGLLSLSLFATVAVGFLFPRANLNPEANTLLASWQSVTMPSDYSTSANRFAFEMGRLELFGKPAATKVEKSVDAPVEEAPLSLVAIARLDNKPVALIGESKLFPVRLSVGQSTASGWQISDIDVEASTVTLTRGDQSRILRLYPDPEDDVPG